VRTEGAPLRRTPDPDAIVRPRNGGVKYPPYLTSWDGGAMNPIHNHRAYIDAHGNGVTDVVASHHHQVRQGRVSSVAGHTHSITRLPAGKG